MGWVTAIVAITALAMLGFVLWRADAEKRWRDQAEGLRERLGHDGPARPSPRRPATELTPARRHVQQ